MAPITFIIVPNKFFNESNIPFTTLPTLFIVCFKFFAKDPEAPFSNLDNTYNNMDCLSLFGKSTACITKKDRMCIKTYRFFN